MVHGSRWLLKKKTVAQRQEMVSGTLAITKQKAEDGAQNITPWVETA